MRSCTPQKQPPARIAFSYASVIALPPGRPVPDPVTDDGTVSGVRSIPPTRRGSAPVAWPRPYHRLVRPDGRKRVSSETLEFQAETRQLLHLMVHSIYSNKDIFLRELISNGSDALDKLRLESMIDKDLEADTSDLHITLAVSAEDRTLTVRDNGIGMSRDEVIQLIGTIAKSGTAEMLRKMRESKDAAAKQELIGQFGVGFYSTFMVA